jgi:hypothetical protein
LALQNGVRISTHGVIALIWPSQVPPDLNDPSALTENWPSNEIDNAPEVSAHLWAVCSLHFRRLIIILTGCTNGLGPTRGVFRSPS